MATNDAGSAGGPVRYPPACRRGAEAEAVVPMTGVRSVRGAVNAVLNGMIREGVITAFETNFDNPTSIAFALHVRVTADIVTDPRKPGFDRSRFDSLRERIGRELEPLSPGVVVSVRPTPGTTAEARTPVDAGEQCRTARRLLDWSTEDLARRAGVSVSAVNSFERNVNVPRSETLRAIIRALEAGGVEFGDGEVAMKAKAPKAEALKRRRS